MARPILCLVGAALIAGCSTNEVIDPVASPRLAALAKQEPSRLKVVIAPVDDLRPKSTPATADAAAVTSANVPQFDAGAFRAEVVRALEAARAFDRIRTTDGKTKQEILASAHEERDDVIVNLAVRRYDLAYRGYDEHQARTFASIALFFQFGFPHWWIADEDYACTIQLEATLTAVGSERPLATMHRKLYAPESHKATLNDFERGLTPFWPIQDGEDVDEEAWLQIATVTAPPAREKAIVALATDLKDPVKVSASRPEFAARYVVSVGAGHLKELPKHTLVQAEEDATEVHALLVERGGIPEKNAGRPLLSSAATRNGILMALRKTAMRTRAQDLTYFYYAGFGATVEGEPCLVPADFDPARPKETLLPLAQLADALDSVHGELVVIIDASFVASDQSYVRTLQVPGISSEGPKPGAFDRLKRAGRVCVLSAGPTGLARTVEQGNGNFTAFLLEEAQSPGAAANAQGFVTLNAIFEKVRGNTAAAFDPPQEPAWISMAGGPEGRDEIEIPLARRGR